MNNFFLIIICILISSCSSIVSLYPTYSPTIPKGEKQWLNINTGESANFNLYTACYHEGRETLRKKDSILFNEGYSHHRNYQIALYQGKCLYEKGYRFSPSVFSVYCMHYSNKDECEAYKEYRK